ncbi:hypothetical protein AcW1_004349 [Taiwanofungus camphoratus]|nr:hypothetical protein AcV5_000727 [Antrodia cinnamomea]KAI0959553.1 hypothetical protein AcW1_004349 [Antrodia cinnamomea]
MTAAEKAQKLRSLIRLLSDASEVVINEWEAEETTSSAQSESLLPSAELKDARRIILGASGMCVDLVQAPASRLTDVACSFFPARALHIAVRARIPDILANADPKEGLPVQEISQQAGVDEDKLTRVLRCLCTIQIFNEVKNKNFVNSPTSQSLVNNEPLRCWILLHGEELYTASDKLMPLLFDPTKTHSNANRGSAWQEVTGTKQNVWEYLEERIQQPDGRMQSRPQLAIWALGMVGGGRALAPSLYADFPWESLGSGIVIDVGGGVGGTSLDLAKRFPRLQFIVQDRASTIQQGEAIWLRELPDAVEAGRIKFVAHNFFAEQPVKGADVYLLRYILHDWPDDECVTILTGLRQAMGTNSRILIADQIINTTVGSVYIKAAPSPLPPNYGYASSFGNVHDLTMMAIHNGKERTPEQLLELADRAGLKLTQIWEGRGIISIAEMRRND